MNRLRFALAPLVVGLLAFGVYLTTLAPDLTWAHAGTDGGDLVTAAYVWGVPHPPGYPTYTFIGHLFASLPFASVAYNLNLMSALTGALACALLAAAILLTFRNAPARVRVPNPAECGGLPNPPRATRDLPILKLIGSRGLMAQFAAAVAGLTCALGPMLWGQSTIAEVHALNAFFAAAMCLITLPWIKRDQTLGPHLRMALGLLWGIGLGNSLTLIAFAPIVVPALWRATQRRWIGWLAFAAGLGVYALIPLRANTIPSINWGDARTLSNFVWVVSGALYQGYALAATPELIVQRLIALPRVWLEQSGWIGVVWVLWAARAPRVRFAAAAWSIAAYILFAVTYDTADSDLYLIPVWMLSTGYAAMGLIHVLNAQPNRLRRWLVSGPAVIAPLVLLLSGWATHDLHNDHSVSEFAQQTLDALPSDAILITHADAHTFVLWYYGQVQQRRRDISIVDARLIEYEWYVPMLNAQGASPALVEPRTSFDLLQRLAAVNPARPICELEPQPTRLTCHPRLAADP